jgi:DNA repair protein SbcD/Mre11
VTTDSRRTSFKFVHAADLHLDSPFQNLKRKGNLPVEELKAASRDAFSALIKLCLDENVDFLLLAGDIYDGEWRDVQPAIFLGKQLQRLAKAGIPTYIILGNHDASNKGVKGFKTFVEDNAVVFSATEAETSEVPGLAVAIHGQSFASREMTENLARGYPGPTKSSFNIGLLHTALEGRDGHDNYAPTTVPELTAKGYDYWALGHIHKKEVVSEDPYIVFSGNLQGRSIRELGPKGAYLIEVEDGGVSGLEFRELSSFRWVELTVPVEENSSSSVIINLCCDAAKLSRKTAPDKRFIVRFVVDGNSALDPEFLHERLQVSLEDLFEDTVLLEGVKFQARDELQSTESQEDQSAFLSDLVLSESEMVDLIEMSLGPLEEKLPSELKKSDENDDLPRADFVSWKEEALVLLNEIAAAKRSEDAS